MLKKIKKIKKNVNALKIVVIKRNSKIELKFQTLKLKFFLNNCIKINSLYLRDLNSASTLAGFTSGRIAS